MLFLAHFHYQHERYIVHYSQGTNSTKCQYTIWLEKQNKKKIDFFTINGPAKTGQTRLLPPPLQQSHSIEWTYCTKHIELPHLLRLFYPPLTWFSFLSFCQGACCVVFRHFSFQRVPVLLRANKNTRSTTVLQKLQHNYKRKKLMKNCMFEHLTACPSPDLLECLCFTFRRSRVCPSHIDHVPPISGCILSISSNGLTNSIFLPPAL